MGTIVIGYVPTPEGEAALEAGIAEARLRGATIVAVSSHPEERYQRQVERVDARAELSELHHRLADSGVPHEVRYLERGFEPAEDVISIAETEQAELIVIGLRRRTPVGKLMMGSNSQRVLLDADCPVLAVKAPLPD